MPRFTLRRLSNQPLPANVKSLSQGLRWSPGKPLGRKPWQARERTWPSWDPGCTCWRGGRQTLWWTTVFLGTTLAPWGGASLTGPNTARNYKVTKGKEAAAGGSPPGLCWCVPICRDTWDRGENQIQLSLLTKQENEIERDSWDIETISRMRING